MSSLEKRSLAADLLGDPHAHLHMSIEADAVGRHTEGCRLADIVQQGGPGQGQRRTLGQLVEQQERVHPYIAFRVVLGRLLDAFHPRHLRQNLRKQPGRIQQLEGPLGMALGQHLGQLVADSLMADLIDRCCLLPDGRGGCRRELKAKTRCEADGSQHAQLVLREAEPRLPNRPHHSGGQVLHPADKIERGRAGAPCLGEDLGVEQHPVDGEVAALHIFFGAL